MTASVTMRMWRSMSCASWRPDPRHGAEPREPSYADWRSPAETGCRAASAPRRTLRACGAGRLALEQIPSARTPTALGEPPNVCTRMSSRLQKSSTVPRYELDAVMCNRPRRSTPLSSCAAAGLRRLPCSVGLSGPCRSPTLRRRVAAVDHHTTAGIGQAAGDPAAAAAPPANQRCPTASNRGLTARQQPAPQARPTRIPR